jgi:hypothetical protein
MNKFGLMAVYGILVLSYPVGVWANEDPPVCTDIGELMYGDQQKCKKGDILMINPMMAAFLCDLSLPSISGEKSVVCHYLGKKRSERKSKK